jgi:hypothetical protein
MLISCEEGRWQRTVGCREVERESNTLLMNASIFRFFVISQSMRRKKKRKKENMGVLVQIENGDKK